MQAALPKAELRRSTRAATRAAQRQPHAEQPLAIPSQPAPPLTPEDGPSAHSPLPHAEGCPARQDSQAAASDADRRSSQAAVPEISSIEDNDTLIQPPSTAGQVHAEGPALQGGPDSQDASALPGTQLALTGKQQWQKSSCGCSQERLVSSF